MIILAVILVFVIFVLLIAVLIQISKADESYGELIKGIKKGLHYVNYKLDVIIAYRQARDDEEINKNK